MDVSSLYRKVDAADVGKEEVVMACLVVQGGMRSSGILTHAVNMPKLPDRW